MPLTSTAPPPRPRRLDDARRAAAAELLERCGPKVARLVAARLRRRGVAVDPDECLAEYGAFLVAAAAAWDPDAGTTLAGYTFGHACRAVAARLARSRRGPPTASLDALAAGGFEPTVRDPEPGAAGDAAALLARAALTPRQRQAVVGLYLDGLAPGDVAARLGVSGQRVGQLERTAVGRLREAAGCEG